ncbi:MAG: NHL repeat-containing protein, partial [Candidatus Omnitrophica bacterium]|nr:NHL repeat-containing protein [Candidatus Omnitrophota bacterium]
MVRETKFKTLVLSLLFFSLIFPPLAHAKLENFQEADVVVGQPDFTTSSSGSGAAKLNSARAVFSDGKRLFVADRSNHRILIWNKIPTSNGTPADVVVGQPDFGTVSSGTTQIKFNTPRGVFFDGQRLFVADTFNSRVLIWNSLPQANGVPADIVLGHSDFTSNAQNDGGAVRPNTLFAPESVQSDGKRLFVCDRGNNRILIYNTIPTSNFASADGVVIGQPDLFSGTANNGGRGSASLNNPESIALAGEKLFVLDTFNQRVLIWNRIPTTNFASADVVIGQPDFVSATANNGGLGPQALSAALGIFSDGKRMILSDSGNHRTLIWNTIPTRNFTSADIVLGQPDFISGSANSGGVSAKSSNVPCPSSFDGKRLFVADASNNRVLIFNIASGSGIKLSPQFEQGKAVIGKVFHDVNGDGIQNNGAVPSKARDGNGVQDGTVNSPQSIDHGEKRASGILSRILSF